LISLAQACLGYTYDGIIGEDRRAKHFDGLTMTATSCAPVLPEIGTCRGWDTLQHIQHAISAPCPAL